MARITIENLKETKLSQEDLERVTGGMNAAFADGSVRPAEFHALRGTYLKFELEKV